MNRRSKPSAPSEAKAYVFVGPFGARLKPCPFKTDL
jgi:hypothetical protein